MIESPLLPHIGAYIAGKWSQAASGRTLPVHNPASGEHLADVPDMAGEETTAAIEAAARAVDQEVAAAERAGWLRGIHDLLLEHRQEMARIITLEQGKPLKESVVEVEYAAGFFRFYGEQLSALAPRILPEPIRGAQWTIHHRPAGVVGLITPWNFPLAMLAKKLAPALGAGCGVVAKPAELTPLTAIALCHLAERAGVPAGRLNLVIGHAAPIGETLCAHPAVRLISFTGSTEVGRILMQNCAPGLKRLALELGGNAPFLVFADADLEAAADALMANKFRCAGQTCVCANRVLVQHEVADRFAEMMAERVGKLRVGNGLDPQTDIGPLINRAGVEKVSRHVQDALDRGARRIVGNEPREGGGTFYPPTVLTGVTPEMLVSREETFGPVVAIGAFDSEDQAIALANGTPFGLAAYVFTRDAERAERLASRLVFGHVGLNTGSGPTPEAPFGGMKQSGFGREGGVEGLLEFCETQTLVRA